MSDMDKAEEIMQAIAKKLGVAVGELWSIVVRQYIVRGLNELISAVTIYFVAYSLHQNIGYWSFAIAAIGHIFLYGAISLLGNPKYYALDDIIKRFKEAKSEAWTS